MKDTKKSLPNNSRSKYLFRLNYPWLKSKDARKVKCCLCGGKNKTADKFSFLINTEEFKIKHCLKDDLMYLYPQPGPKYAESLYNHPAYFQGIDDMYGLTVDDKKSQQIAKIRIQEILKYKPSAKSILEIGCGHGHTLIEARKAGFKKADGIEFSKDAVKVCRQKKLNIYQADLRISLKYLIKNRYDVVAMYSVLEHLQNPLVFLKNVKPLIAAGGILVVRVPKTSASGPTLSLVDHLWHFTSKSIKKTLHRLDFSVTDIFGSGTFQGIQHKGFLKSMTVIAKNKDNSYV